MSSQDQLHLFSGQNLNVVYEVKRQLRIALANSKLSRDEVVDQATKIAWRDGVQSFISKATLDSWCKDSEPGRMPSLGMLVILCHVLGTLDPIKPLVNPLGGTVIGREDLKVLSFGRAEMMKRRAQKSARRAADELGL